MASTVLVVEDDPDCREILLEFLALKGYGAIQAVNGKDALEKLKKQEGRPGLILLDLSLPLMSGWEFREQQIRDAELRDIPVIIVSAAQDAAEDALEADGYFKKPLDLDKLGALLERFYRLA